MTGHKYHNTGNCVTIVLYKNQIKWCMWYMRQLGTVPTGRYSADVTKIDCHGKKLFIGSM